MRKSGIRNLRRGCSYASCVSLLIVLKAWPLQVHAAPTCSTQSSSTPGVPFQRRAVEDCRAIWSGLSDDQFPLVVQATDGAASYQFWIMGPDQKKDPDRNDGHRLTIGGQLGPQFLGHGLKVTAAGMSTQVNAYLRITRGNHARLWVGLPLRYDFVPTGPVANFEYSDNVQRFSAAAAVAMDVSLGKGHRLFLHTDIGFVSTLYRDPTPAEHAFQFQAGVAAKFRIHRYEGTSRTLSLVVDLPVGFSCDPNVCYGGTLRTNFAPVVGLEWAFNASYPQ